MTRLAVGQGDKGFVRVAVVFKRFGGLRMRLFSVAYAWSCEAAELWLHKGFNFLEVMAASHRAKRAG